MLRLFVKLLPVGYTAVQSLKAVSENILLFSAVFENNCLLALQIGLHYEKSMLIL